jgi:hypothetical protein
MRKTGCKKERVLSTLCHGKGFRWMGKITAWQSSYATHFEGIFHYSLTLGCVTDHHSGEKCGLAIHLGLRAKHE